MSRRPAGGCRNQDRPIGNADFKSWDPTPVNAFLETSSDFGAVEMIGNGWEWTSTVFAPFAGFEPFPFYPGYSANFFVLEGGRAHHNQPAAGP